MSPSEKPMPSQLPLHPAVIPCTVGFLILVPEIVLLITRYSQRKSAARADGSSLLQLWGTILTSIAVATPFGYLQAPNSLQFELGFAGLALALGILTTGVLLRWWAVYTLGKFFTVDVAVHREHRLVTGGPYAWIRHPSYTGLLLEFFALSLTFQNALCIVIILAPTITALLWRITVEEKALSAGLGEVYQTYLQRSYCLVPFVSLRRWAIRPMPQPAGVIHIESANHVERTGRLSLRRRRRSSVGAETARAPLPPVPQRDSHAA
jgi:protein-S-isoprenylcysteine O-methyltransferase